MRPQMQTSSRWRRYILASLWNRGWLVPTTSCTVDCLHKWNQKESRWTSRWLVGSCDSRHIRVCHENGQRGNEVIQFNVQLWVNWIFNYKFVMFFLLLTKELLRVEAIIGSISENTWVHKCIYTRATSCLYVRERLSLDVQLLYVKRRCSQSELYGCSVVGC